MAKLPRRYPVTLTGCGSCNTPAEVHRDSERPDNPGRHQFATPTPDQFKKRLPKHDQTTAPLPAEIRARVMAELLAHATTSAETNAVRRVLLASGYGWRCRCGADQFPTAAACGACDNLRPTRAS